MVAFQRACRVGREAEERGGCKWPPTGRGPSTAGAAACPSPALRGIPPPPTKPKRTSASGCAMPSSDMVRFWVTCGAERDHVARVWLMRARGGCKPARASERASCERATPCPAGTHRKGVGRVDAQDGLRPRARGRPAAAVHHQRVEGGVKGLHTQVLHLLKNDGREADAAGEALHKGAQRGVVAGHRLQRQALLLVNHKHQHALGGRRRRGDLRAGGGERAGGRRREAGGSSSGTAGPACERRLPAASGVQQLVHMLHGTAVHCTILGCRCSLKYKMPLLPPLSPPARHPRSPL